MPQGSLLALRLRMWISERAGSGARRVALAARISMQVHHTTPHGRKLRAGHLAAAFVLAALLGPGAGCARKAPAEPYPHESVLAVIAELRIHLLFDPYRAVPGQDLEGRNIFRVSLARLNELDQILGEEYADIIAFGRAECFERLTQWDAAAASFARVVQSGSSLAEEAAIRRKWAERIADVTSEREEAVTIESYLNRLASIQTRLLNLLDPEPVFPYASLLRVELERAREKAALMLFRNRYTLAEGSDRAVHAARALIEHHADSRRDGEHRLLLGGFFADLAGDYARLNPPATAQFESSIWESYIADAREQFAIAARADGDPAKPEAQARLRALDAYTQRTLNEAR